MEYKLAICKETNKNLSLQKVKLIVLFILFLLIYSIEKVYLCNDLDYKPFLSRLAIFIFLLNVLVTIWKNYQRIEILGNCCVSKYYCTTKFYLSDAVIGVHNSIGLFDKKYNEIGTIDSRGRFNVLFITSKNDENVSTIVNIVQTKENHFLTPPPIGPTFNKHYFLAFNNRKYETKKILEYGQLTENATLVGGMDKFRGRYIPVYQFTYNGEKYMTWGIERMNKEQLRKKMGKKLIVLFAPGKSKFVHEIDYTKSLGM